MNLDHSALDLLRQQHPAWRLLRADHAPLIASFLQRVFVTLNIRVIHQADLAEALEDELFDLLRQISEGSQSNPELRLADLQRRRDEIDLEIARVQGGDIPVLEDSAIKDRFQQFVQIARELLTDFRQVQCNFRDLDREVRERIALWNGSKVELLCKRS